MSSPRHISANVVPNINSAQHAISNPSAVDSVVPMRTTLLGDRTRPPHVSLTTAAASDLLYPPSASTRIVDDPMSNALAQAHAALTSAVIEALFSDGRKKEAAVPTPAEFRLALRHMKEQARAKSKKQRDDARAKCARLQNALASLVGSQVPSRPADVESDDSDEDLGTTAQLTAKRDWAIPYERK